MAHSPARFWIIMALAACTIPATATELKSPTVEAYEHYVALTEARMTADEHNGRFLSIDGFPADAKQKAYADLQKGELYIERTRTTDDGHNIRVPDGLIHHWQGVVFIPGATLVDTLGFLQDADHYEEIFKPAVRRSHLISWGENEMKISEQFYHKTVVTVTVNTDFDAHYTFLDPNHLVCRAHSTRVAEVEHVGQDDEHELPVGNDHGYLWRMNTYWHIEQKDGGVYLEVETIALTRNVPMAVQWIVAPLIKSIPRGSMSTFLTTTRTTVTSRQAKNQTATGSTRSPEVPVSPVAASEAAPQRRP